MSSFGVERHGFEGRLVDDEQCRGCQARAELLCRMGLVAVPIGDLLTHQDTRGLLDDFNREAKLKGTAMGGAIS
jgi:hypothetical protein